MAKLRTYLAAVMLTLSMFAVPASQATAHVVDLSSARLEAENPSNSPPIMSATRQFRRISEMCQLSDTSGGNHLLEMYADSTKGARYGRFRGRFEAGAHR
jgi:hypothetical protein